MKVDVLVAGATPAGIAAAVRASREGLSVALTNRTAHLGGMWTSGLQFFDTIFEGSRAPLLDEFLGRVQSYYAAKYGADSPEVIMARYGDPRSHGRRPRFEPHVAEAVFDEMVGAEPNITVFRGWVPVAVVRNSTLVTAVELGRYRGSEVQRVEARVFIDATYEGDLAAFTGAPYAVGRESRSAYGEPHAGRIFSRIHPVAYPKHEYMDRMHLHYFNRTSGEIFAGSTGEGDGAVMAYCARLVLTDDPDNMIPIGKPDDYDADVYLPILQDETANLDVPTLLGSHQVVNDVSSMALGKPSVPGRKKDWIGANLVGASHAYPDADWPEREAIIGRHLDFALGMLYFLKSDLRVPESVRSSVSAWGLPRDEFVDNGGIPWEIYVREARRIVGRSVITELDATLAPGLSRAPIRPGSIAFSEWPMDSHDCRAERVPGSLNDGEIMLTEITRPPQIPYSALLPRGVDNVVVAVCLSATHVAWGTVRVEPTLMHIGESVGWSAVLSREMDCTPADLTPDLLVRRLVDRKVMVSFFNDHDMTSTDAWVPAVQFLSTKGFFTSYDSGADRPLQPEVARVWARGGTALALDRLDCASFALEVAAAEKRAAKSPTEGAPDSGSGALTDAQFLEMIGRNLELHEGADGARAALERAPRHNTPLTWGDAASILFDLVGRA